MKSQQAGRMRTVAISINCCFNHYEWRVHLQLSRLGRDTYEIYLDTLHSASRRNSSSKGLACGSRQRNLTCCRSRLALLRALPGNDARQVQLRAACCALLLQTLVPPSTRSQVCCPSGCTNALIITVFFIVYKFINFYSFIRVHINWIICAQA